MIRFPILLLLVASVASAECVTACGLHVQGGSCEGAQLAETRAIAALAQVVPDWDPGALCHALTGWRVRVHRRGAQDRDCPTELNAFRVGPICVVGYTFSKTRTIEVESPTWRSNSLSHELVHVFQYGLHEPLGHCAWDTRGILAVLHSLTGTADGSNTAEPCSPWTEDP